MRRAWPLAVVAALAGCGGGTQAHQPPKLQVARATHEYPSPKPRAETVSAGLPTAVQAVRSFASAYINWTAGTVASDMRALAGRSVGAGALGARVGGGPDGFGLRTPARRNRELRHGRGGRAVATREPRVRGRDSRVDQRDQHHGLRRPAPGMARCARDGQPCRPRVGRERMAAAGLTRWSPAGEGSRSDRVVAGRWLATGAPARQSPHLSPSDQAGQRDRGRQGERRHPSRYAGVSWAAVGSQAEAAIARFRTEAATAKS